MKVYKASYWCDGPGAPQSGMRDVLVLAKNKRKAMKHLKERVVSISDHDTITIKAYKTDKSFVVNQEDAW